MSGKRVIPATPAMCCANKMTAAVTAGNRNATITKRVSQTRLLRAGSSTMTKGARSGDSSHSGVPVVSQKDQPGGAGGQFGGGLHPFGGRHPSGGGGQFGGDRQAQPSSDIEGDSRSR